MTTPARAWPRTVDCHGIAVAIDLMTAGDQVGVEQFVADLPADDLLFVPRDISHPKVMQAWMRALDKGTIHSLIARSGGRVVGCTSIYIDRMSWSRHVGELRVLVAATLRGKGLGRTLIQACFAQALGLGLKKLTAHMTTQQAGAVTVFEDLGFRAEALLRDHVMDPGGGTHDLVILSHDVEAVAARHTAYGMETATHN
jgi:RimJ/RimL family protein N-acetyltransferase